MLLNDVTLMENVDRPIVAIRNDYPSDFELDWHSHRRGQLLYAARGVVVLSTPAGAWVAPPERAVWTPGGCSHSVRMVGAVSTRSLLVEPAAYGALGLRTKVIQVSPLLRALLEAASGIEPEYDVAGRDGMVMALLLEELTRAPTVPLAVPFPKRPDIARRCQRFLERPSPHDTIDRWSDELGMGRRAFTRAFRRETGLSFGMWRQQACLLVALPRLAAGEAVTTVALDLGYESPAAFTTMFKRLVGVAPSHYHPAAA
ncbi:transcriptional regulator [Sphingobium jiangsuense]|uniref:AraC-like DNA-binding protein n=1 Tax=Sphingobium jiangsuense TaxID=870476 RepID=A0A7W6BSS1_9SPHN|nr:helix-turn-helix transcriptional regulator [Sphingobium jiangsuense]MBB3927174.1 AraC-like DNA-binding protein [Sphingobium jiangsuense]GLS99546.1 transcriptional regulator [Sphingobium jiangsuense]